MTKTGIGANQDRAGSEAQYCREIFEQSSGAILANMSHELRTPLNGIIGFSELLERRNFGPLTERQRSYVRNIHECGWRLLKLVIDIVDLSKIETGRLLLSREWVSLDPLIDAALSDSRALADKKRVALIASLHPDLPTVWVDPMRMQQVFCNLLSIAVRLTPESGSVGLTVYEEPTAVRVSVTGIEMAAGPPGEQVEDGGLGLALAKRLLEMHGGRIQVITGVSGGSTITATIPLNQQDEED